MEDKSARSGQPGAFILRREASAVAKAIGKTGSNLTLILNFRQDYYPVLICSGLVFTGGRRIE